VTPRPPDFEPLAGSDPVLGDPDRVAVIARRYRDTAAEIAKQASNLRTLTQQAEGGWKGKAGDVFREHASDLADRISKAQGRYAAAGDALNGWVRPLSDAQDEVYQAVWDAKAAQQQMTANAPPPPPKPGAPPPTPDEQAQEKKRSTAYGQGQTALGAARTTFDRAVGDYHTAAGAAARKINDAIGHDGLKDSWWDRNFHWIKIVMEVIAVIVIVLAIAALLLACPFAAGFVLFGLTAETLATIAETALVVLTLVQLAYDSTAAATGKESWTAAILDVVSLCTFGFGKLAAARAQGPGRRRPRRRQDGFRGPGRPGVHGGQRPARPPVLTRQPVRLRQGGHDPVRQGPGHRRRDQRRERRQDRADPTGGGGQADQPAVAVVVEQGSRHRGGQAQYPRRQPARRGPGHVPAGPGPGPVRGRRRGCSGAAFVAAGGYNAHAIVTDTFSDEGVGQTLADFRHMMSAVP